MIIREPAVAGQFYPANADRCRAELLQHLEKGAADYDSKKHPVGGLVPHAGWVYSGAVAAGVFSALAASRSPDVVILLGSVHRFRGKEAALFGAGRWETPLGPLTVDARLAERILGHTNLIVDDPYAHRVFAGVDPIADTTPAADLRFRRLAHRVFGPLAEHLAEGESC